MATTEERQKKHRGKERERGRKRETNVARGRIGKFFLNCFSFIFFVFIGFNLFEF